jgi:hypothetical protein
MTRNPVSMIVEIKRRAVCINVEAGKQPVAFGNQSVL